MAVEAPPAQATRRPEALPQHAPAPSPARRRALAYTGAGLVYLAVAVALWWHVWTSHPTSVTVCGCGDPSEFTWYMAWPAYALAHGHSLFFSRALAHPTGVNLLANTSVLAIGVPLAPVTWLFGPVAALNVAMTLTPVLSAMAAFWLARRFVSWSPAALLAGLLFGFSPFVLSNLSYAHLMTAALVVVPLWVGAWHELLIVRRRSPVWVGVVIGLLAVVEFFVSTEVLVILAMCTVLGLVLLGAHGALRHRRELAHQARSVLPGVAAAAVVAVVLLAYPAWFALDGPARLSGEIWPNIPVIGGYTPAAFVNATQGTQRSVLLLIGGYEGAPLPSAAFLGWGMLAVLVGGLAWFRRDRRLWFFFAMAVATAALSLGERKAYWVPWRLLGHLPVIGNIVEQRFGAVTYLAVALMLAIVLDHLRRLRLPSRPLGRHWSRGARRAVRLLLALGAAALALVPMAVAFGEYLPFTVQGVDLPAWFATTGAHLAPGQVVLAYPAPFSGIQSAETWQAVDGLRWAQAGIGGPQGTVDRAGDQRAAFLSLAHLGFGFYPPPTGTRPELAAVRGALRAWGVTMVVIPDQPGLRSVFRGRDPVYAAAFMTAAIGRKPVIEHEAWVWGHVQHLSAPLEPGPGELASCTQAAERAGQPLQAVSDCVARARGTAASGGDAG